MRELEGGCSGPTFRNGPSAECELTARFAESLQGHHRLWQGIPLTGSEVKVENRECRIGGMGLISHSLCVYLELTRG